MPIQSAKLTIFFEVNKIQTVFALSVTIIY